MLNVVVIPGLRADICCAVLRGSLYVCNVTSVRLSSWINKGAYHYYNLSVTVTLTNETLQRNGLFLFCHKITARLRFLIKMCYINSLLLLLLLLLSQSQWPRGSTYMMPLSKYERNRSDSWPSHSRCCTGLSSSKVSNSTVLYAAVPYSSCAYHIRTTNNTTHGNDPPCCCYEAAGAKKFQFRNAVALISGNDCIGLVSGAKPPEPPCPDPFHYGLSLNLNPNLNPNPNSNPRLNPKS